MQLEANGEYLVSPTRRRVAIALLVIGAAVAVPCGVVAALSAKNDLKIVGSAATPSQFEVTIRSGEWEIYEQTGTVSGGSIGFFHYSSTTGQPLDIDASDIRVEDSQGIALALRRRFSNHSFDTYDTGSHIYTGVASFEAPSAGRYSVAVTSPGSDTVIVARRPLAAVAASVPLIIGAAAGGVAFVVGLILLILDLDRRRRARYPRHGPGTARPWEAPPVPLPSSGPRHWSPAPGRRWAPVSPPSPPPEPRSPP